MSLSPRPHHSPPDCQLPPSIPSQPPLPNYSPPKTDSEEEAEEGLVIRPAVLGKTKAKKRLLAFSIAKNTAVKPIQEKKEKKLKKKVIKAPEDPIAATVAAIESEKKEIIRNIPPELTLNTLGPPSRFRGDRRRKGRSKSRSRERTSRRSRERKDSRGHKSKSPSSRDRERKTSKDDKTKPVDTPLPDSWEGLKEAGITVGDDFRRLKWRSSAKAATSEKIDLLSESRTLKPIVDFTQPERQPKSRYYAKPFGGGRKPHELCVYLRHLVHVTNTQPPLVWAANPSLQELPFLLPREYYEANATPQQLRIFQHIADATAVSHVKESSSSRSSWYPKTDFLRATKDSRPSSPESVKPAEPAVSSTTRTRRVSLVDVNYDSPRDLSPKDSAKTEVTSVSVKKRNDPAPESADETSVEEYISEEEDFELVKDVSFSEPTTTKAEVAEKKPGVARRKYRKSAHSRSSSSSSSSSEASESDETENKTNAKRDGLKVQKRGSENLKADIFKSEKRALSKEAADKQNIKRKDTSKDKSGGKAPKEDSKNATKAKNGKNGEVTDDLKRRSRKDSKTEIHRTSENSKERKKDKSEEADRARDKTRKASPPKAPPQEESTKGRKVPKEGRIAETLKLPEKDKRGNRRLSKEVSEEESSKSRKEDPVKNLPKDHKPKKVTTDNDSKKPNKSKTRVISKETGAKYSTSYSSDSEEELPKKRKSVKEEVSSKKKGARDGSLAKKKPSKEDSSGRKKPKKDRKSKTDESASESNKSAARMHTKRSSRGRSTWDDDHRMSSDELEEGQISEDGVESPIVYASSASSLKLTKSPLVTATPTSATRPPQKLVSEYEEFLKQVEPEPGDIPKGKGNDWDNESDVDTSKSRKRKLSEIAPSEPALAPKRSKKDKAKETDKKQKKKKARKSSSSESESSSESDSKGKKKKKKKIKKRRKKKKKHVKKSKKVSSSSSSSSSSSESDSGSSDNDSKKRRKHKMEKGNDSTEQLMLNLQLMKQELARKLSEQQSSDVVDKKHKKAISKQLRDLEKSRSHRAQELRGSQKALKKKKKAKKTSRKSSESESGGKNGRNVETQNSSLSSVAETVQGKEQDSKAVKKDVFSESDDDFKMSGKRNAEIVVGDSPLKIRKVDEDSSGWEEDCTTPSVSASTTSRSASKAASAASDDHFTLEAASPPTPTSTHLSRSSPTPPKRPREERAAVLERYSPGASSYSDDEPVMQVSGRSVATASMKGVAVSSVEDKDIYDPLAVDSDSTGDVVPLPLAMGLAEIPLPTLSVPSLHEIRLPGEMNIDIPMPAKKVLPVVAPLPPPKPAAVVSPVRAKHWQEGTALPSQPVAVTLASEPLSATTMSPNAAQKTAQVLKMKAQNRLQLRVAAVFREDSDEDVNSKKTSLPAIGASSAAVAEKASGGVANEDVTDMAVKRNDGSRDSKQDSRKDGSDRDQGRNDKDKIRRDDHDRKSDRDRRDGDRPKEKRRSPSPRRREKRRSPERKDRPRRRTRSPDHWDKRSRTPEKRDRRSRRAKSPTPRKARSPSPRKSRGQSPRKAALSPSPRRRSPTPVKRPRSPSPKRRRSPSPARRPRSPSPRRRRHPDSPKRRRSKSRSRSPRQRRRRSRSRSLPRRGMSPASLLAGHGALPAHILPPPPLMAQSVHLMGQPPPITAPPFPPPNTAEGHQRLSLDQRIELELGVKLHDTPPATPSRQQQHHHYYFPQQSHPHPHPHHHYPHHYPQPSGAVLQVGNIMEVVPSRGAPPPPPLPHQQIVQVGNVLQVVPARATAVVAPTPQAPESQQQPPSQRQEIEVLQDNPLINAMQKEREKRVKEKEARRLERETRRKTRQAKRNAKLLSVTEKLKQVEHNEGAVLGQDPEDEELLLEAMEPPSPPAPMHIVIDDHLPPGKSILLIPTLSRTTSSTKKSVRFADGLRPGEQSESEGEAIVAAAKLKDAKEKRYKKKLKKKVKVRIVRQQPVAAMTSDDEDDDNLPPPSPPPGDPPPVFYATFPFGGQFQYPVYQTSMPAPHRGSLLTATAVP